MVTKSKTMLKAILKLIRIPNLLIIIASMYLVRFFLISPILNFFGGGLIYPELDFALLVLSCVLIAAAGYIINDYFDLEIDKINKPEKIIIGEKIPVETARVIYFLLNLLGVLIGTYLSVKIDQYQFALIFLLTAFLLFSYSQKYKRSVFIGNFVVAALSAVTLFLVWLFEFFSLRLQADTFIEMRVAIPFINTYILGYVSFAFLVSLIREIIKDIEDREGDEAVKCKTLPIIISVRNSKILIGSLILLAIGLMGYAQFILWKFNLDYLLWYFIIAVQPLFVYLFINLLKAKEKEDFHFMSMISKIIMLAGILSIQLIQLHY